MDAVLCTEPLSSARSTMKSLDAFIVEAEQGERRPLLARYEPRKAILTILLVMDVQG